MPTRVSLAELAAADIRLRPDEAVAIIAEVCGQYTSGRLPGIPSAGVIRLTREGDVLAEGPMTTGAAGVARAAHLLNDLLPDFDAPAGYRARGGLRLAIARALGTLDLPPYRSLEEFCAALGRFAAPIWNDGAEPACRLGTGTGPPASGPAGAHDFRHPPRAPRDGTVAR
jgi:hypothetical protein